MPSVHSRSPSPAGRGGGGDSKRRRTHHSLREPDSPGGSVSSKGRDRDSGRKERSERRERYGDGDERDDRRYRDRERERDRERDERYGRSSRSHRDYADEDDYHRSRSSRSYRRDDDYRSSSRRDEDPSRRSSRREDDEYYRRKERDYERDDRRRSDKHRASAADAGVEPGEGASPRSADARKDRGDRRDRDHYDDRRRGSYDQRDGRPSIRDRQPPEVSIKGIAAAREANGSAEASPRPADDYSGSPPRAAPLKKASFAPIGSNRSPAPVTADQLSSTPGSAAAKARALAEAKEGRLPGESLEEQKLRMKRERLEQWKAKKQAEEAAAFAKAQEASQAAGQPGATKANGTLGTDGTTAATAAAANIAARLGTHPGGPAAAPVGGELQKTLPVGIKGLPARPTFNSFATNTAGDAAPPTKAALGGDDDEHADARKIQKLNFDEIKEDDDLLKHVEAEDDSDEEDLVEGGHGGYRRKEQNGDANEEDDEDEVAVVKGADEGEDSAGPTQMAVDGEEPEIAPAQPTQPRPAWQTRKEPAQEAMVIDPPAAEPVADGDEVDPLDAFMFGVADEVKKVNAVDRQKLKQKAGAGGAAKKIFEDDDDDEDVKAGSDEDMDSMRPEDILALAAKKIKKKDLAPVDHSKINYEPFRRAFYHPPAEVEQLTEEQAENIRLAEDGIKIRGSDCPKPVMKWSWFGLHASALEVIKGLGYPAPTPIQGQAVPAIMSGRDVIGVAKTGSGKTLAFLLPMLRHLKDQRPLEQMEGPIAMIMTPTRELATQIYKEGRPFFKALNLRAACAYGGSPLKDNIADLKRGAEICVCTPGRMIELLTTNSGRVINLRRVTYLVLDEADRMFDMGFEPQVMKIVAQIRPDRQTVLFSATFPKQMEALARKILRPQPLEITVGGRSVVAAEIEQIVEVREESTKFNRLLEIMGRFYNDDPEARTLVFVDRQESADNLFRELLKKGYPCLSLHGGKEQVDRDQVIQDFKAGIVPMVIATSVAARGLDVKQLKLVVNYDAPNHMEDYVHRAGRTGRAGNKGTCITFICPDQDRYAVDLLRALVASKATYPDELKAMSDAFLEKVRSGKAQAAGSGFGGKGLDHLERDRDAKTRAERSAYGETTEEGVREEGEEGRPSGAADAPGAKMDLPELNVEVRRGPAPDSSRRGAIVRAPDTNAVPALAAALKAAQTTAANETDATGASRAKAVAAELNIKLKQMVALKHAQALPGGHDNRSKDPDATDFHAVVPINDYPQKARWKVTNKDTMVQLVESTGASVTNKGVFYEKGRDPGPDEPPKLHLLVESNEEWRVQRAISEIRTILIEATTQALEAEQRNPGQVGAGGRYNVL